MYSKYINLFFFIALSVLGTVYIQQDGWRFALGIADYIVAVLNFSTFLRKLNDNKSEETK